MSRLNSDNSDDRHSVLSNRLVAYMAAAGGMGAVAATSAEGAVVSRTTPQTIGINQEVNIDFNLDGQIDFQIDHDRYVLGSSTLDYLQIDKNDVNGASPGENPLPIDNFATFPLNGTPANSDAEVLTFTNSFGDQGGYAVGLNAGDIIGATGTSPDGLVEGTRWDFQEGDNFLSGGTRIRANRLIDEDQGQIDTALEPSKPLTIPFGPQPEFPLVDDFIGNNGETRYLGVRIDFNDAGQPSFNTNASQYWYGWIGVRIDNEADATGTITGWAYETTKGMSIVAGDVGEQGQTGDFDGDSDVDGRDFLEWQRGNSPAPLSAGDLTDWQTNYGVGPLVAAATSVPEPGSVVTTAIGGICLFSGFAMRRLFRGAKS